MNARVFVTRVIPQVGLDIEKAAHNLVAGLRGEPLPDPVTV